MQLFAIDKQDGFLNKLVNQATTIKKPTPETPRNPNMVTLIISFSDLRSVKNDLLSLKRTKMMIRSENARKPSLLKVFAERV